MSNFKTDLKDGKIAEKHVLTALMKLSFVKSAKLKNTLYSAWDLFCKRLDDTNFTVEVKFDFASITTGNFFFELISSTKNSTLGAGFNCLADYTAIVQKIDSDIIKIIMTDTNKLKYLAMTSLLSKDRNIRNVGRNRKCVGILLPIKKILDNCTEYVIFFNHKNGDININYEEA